MQFKHPEILYFLGFIIIPILVHLFQLQKFKKTPFTNVAFLQKLILQTRKSSKLKKWLILASRILLFSAIIIAFSQPYFSDKKAEKNQHTFIYLDTSLSLNAKGEKGDLLQNAIKEIIENSSENESYSLLTNSDFYENINSNELKKTLLNVKPNAQYRSLEEVLLKIESFKSNRINTLYKSILVSDFQINSKNKKINFTNVTSPISFIKLNLAQKNNISIDSLFIDNQNDNNFTVTVLIKNQGALKNNISIALYNNESVVSKQTFSINENEIKSISFPIQNLTKINGKITLDFDDVFSFDNTFYFTTNSTKKINVFSIGKNHQFLSKIYTKNEFNFSSSSLQNSNYNVLEKQELIILNELEELPTSLRTFLQTHLKEGKSLVVIPNENLNINSYNSFFSNIQIGNIFNKISDSLKITNINFKNPFFRNVFSKDVQNFQYPIVKNYYTSRFKQASSLLNFENQQDFINQISIKNGNVFWFASALNTNTSNFINSPLVVPVFYNFGKFSAKYPKPYYTIGETNLIDVATVLKKDEVLTIKDNVNSFIPLQQLYSTKVTLETTDNPEKQGLYTVNKDNVTIETIAFNYNKSESELTFLNIKEEIKGNENLQYSESIAAVLQKNTEKNKVTWLWKWFLALAIVSLIFEILILKFFKP
ncbi:BatA domain-containing protein [Polaribacter uvawellassae]|uniref:BatA domain-containing protein n=1 Tax=Polaribacter uvawellassae TaxID=3133495 RepID=UPI00321BCC24